jgi:hypothetical protein
MSVDFGSMKGSLGAAVKLLLCDHEVMGASPGTASCKNAGKGCVHKAQSRSYVHRTAQAGAMCTGLPLDFGSM